MFLSAWQVVMAGVGQALTNKMSFIRSPAPPPALRSQVCIYKCTSEFCNMNIAKGVAKVKALRFEVVEPRGCKCWLEVLQRNWSKVQKYTFVCVILFIWMSFYTFVTINLQLRLQNTGVLIIVCVCKSKDSAFQIRAVSVTFNLQTRMLIWQVLTFRSTSSRVLLLIYLHTI